MNAITRIQHSIHAFLLKRRIQNITFPRDAINFNNARKFGLLFNANHQTDVEAVKLFSKSLRDQDKEVELLGYCKKVNKESPLRIPHFTKNEINWYLKPEGKKVNAFINAKFDVLINADLSECVPLAYISAVANARFRVGKYHPNHEYCYDFMIDLNGKHGLQDYFEQVDVYLKMINRKG